jgi:hypothetical protein
MFADEAWKFLVNVGCVKDFAMEEGEARGTYSRGKRGIFVTGAWYDYENVIFSIGLGGLVERTETLP